MINHIKDNHLRDLRASGLSDETIAESGIRSADCEEIAKIVDVSPDWLGSDGFVIPYYSLDKIIIQKRPRLDKPPIGKDGKPCKYLTRKGASNRIYFPSDIIQKKEILQDKNVTLIITEGEKKALKACQEGLNCISLPGVWCFRGVNENTKGPIADLDLINWYGRKVFIIYDSDVSIKVPVKEAQAALREELLRRGAKVIIVNLPPGSNGETVGLDDYLLGHSKEDLLRLAHESRSDDSVLKIQDVADLVDLDIPPRDILIDPILAKEEFSILSGPMKLGKSLIVQQMAMCIATGRDFLDMPVTQGKVLMIQQEISLVGLKDRSIKMSSEFSKDDYRGKFFHLTDKGLKIKDENIPEWLSAAIEYIDPSLLIVDPLYTIHDKDENVGPQMMPIMMCFQNVIKKYGIAVLLVHHHGKKTLTEKEGGELHRGSSVIGAASDNNLIYNRLSRRYDVDESGKRSNYATLLFELRNAEPPDPIKIYRDPSTLISTRAQDLKEVRKVQPEQLIALVRLGDSDVGKVVNSELIKKISKVFKVSPNTARQAIESAIHDNLLVKGKTEGKSYWVSLPSYQSTNLPKHTNDTNVTNVTKATDESIDV